MLAKFNDLPPEEKVNILSKIFSYDPETGKIKWKSSSRRGFNGKESGYKRPDGYMISMVMGSAVYSHRIAFAIFHRRWPLMQIDHKNGIRWDNRILNLRDVTNSENQQNKHSPMKNNSIGILGVTRNSNGNGYTAAIRVDGRKFTLGTFSSAESASFSYMEAKRVLHSSAFDEDCSHASGGVVLKDSTPDS